MKPLILAGGIADVRHEDGAGGRVGRTAGVGGLRELRRGVDVEQRTGQHLLDAVPVRGDGGPVDLDAGTVEHHAAFVSDELRSPDVVRGHG